jgi:hypothetical protein
MVNPLEFNTKNEFMRDKQSKKKKYVSKMDLTEKLLKCFSLL